MTNFFVKSFESIALEDMIVPVAKLVAIDPHVFLSPIGLEFLAKCGAEKQFAKEVRKILYSYKSKDSLIAETGRSLFYSMIFKTVTRIDDLRGDVKTFLKEVIQSVVIAKMKFGDNQVNKAKEDKAYTLFLEDIVKYMMAGHYEVAAGIPALLNKNLLPEKTYESVVKKLQELPGKIENEREKEKVQQALEPIWNKKAKHKKEDNSVVVEEVGKKRGRSKSGPRKSERGRRKTT